MSPSDLLAPTARPHIPPPDIRRPEMMQRLPEWVASRVALLRDDHRREGMGKTLRTRMVPTLPPNLILSGAERVAIEDHMRRLNKLSGQTPIDSVDAEAAMLVVLTKMMLVLPVTKQNEQSAEARGEAYMVALDDLPVWTVEAAIRRWYRSDVGTNADGLPRFDCHWAPQPADLRELATAELRRVQWLSQKLGAVLAAEPAIEFSDEHCAAMRARLTQVIPGIIPLVGKDDSGGTPKEQSASDATVGRDQASARP